MKHEHSTIEPDAPNRTPDTLTVELANALADRDRYYNMLVEIGLMFGIAACVADNGAKQPGVVIGNVPKLVRELIDTKGFKSARLPEPPSAKLPSNPPSPAETAAFTAGVQESRAESAYTEPQAVAEPKAKANRKKPKEK